MKTQCNLNTNPLPNNSFRLMMKKHETGECSFQFLDTTPMNADNRISMRVIYGILQSNAFILS